jgi:hypothetical protein
MKIGQPKLSERVKETGCWFHLFICNSKLALDLMIIEGNKQKKAGPFLNLPFPL